MDGEKLRQERPIPDELTDFIDVTIDGTPANNEVLAWDTTAGKWINQTPSEAGLSTLGLSGTPENADYAKFVVAAGATDLEGRSVSEVRADLSLEDSDINALITATKLDDLTAPDDNTDLDFSTSAHGLVPKGTNVGNFLKDDGTWAAPAGGGTVDTSGTPEDNDVAVFTDADTIEGLSESEFKAHVNLEDSDINALIVATKLDDLTAPDDTTDLDASAALHGLMSKAYASKLDGIATGADVTADNAPQAHKDSHDPNDGSDPLDTANAVDIPGVQAAGTGTSHSLARADHQHQIQESMADDHIVTVNDADAAENDYLKFTATGGVEGRSYSELRSDINVADGADVTGSNAPQAHASSHAVSGADTVFPADPGADRYLMWDDDPGELVWGSPAGGGDVTAAANMVDNTLIKGDGGAKGIQDTGITVDDSENMSGVATLGATTVNVSGILTSNTQIISHKASDTPATTALIDFRRERDGDPTQDVSNGDVLGELRYRGYHTDGYYEGAIIRATVINDAGSDDMPSKLELAVSPDGSGTPATKLTIDADDLTIPVNIGLEFGDGAEKIESDNTDLTINSGGDINLTATGDVNIPANVGVTFGDDGEKIEGNGTDLTINASADLNLTATADINVPANVGMTFGDDGEKIEGDGTNLTIAGGDINLTAEADVNIPANIGLTFGDDGEKIEGDGTDLTISSSGVLNLTPTTQVTLNKKMQLVENEAIYLDSAMSADGKYSTNEAFTGTAGAALAFGEVVYLASADSKWEKAKGDAEATTKPWTATVIVAAAEDATVTLMRRGFIREDDWNFAVPGAPLFISAATAGAMTATELTTGQFQKVVGFETNQADTVYIDHSTDWVKVG